MMIQAILGPAANTVDRATYERIAQQAREFVLSDQPHLDQIGAKPAAVKRLHAQHLLKLRLVQGTRPQLHLA